MNSTVKQGRKRMSQKSKQETSREQASLKLGKFNVQVTLNYLDGTEEVINCNSWNHAGAFLGLDIDPVNLKIVNCMSLKSFHICPQPEYDA